MTIFPQYEQELRKVARRRCASVSTTARSRSWRRLAWLPGLRSAVAVALPVLVVAAVAAATLAGHGGSHIRNRPSHTEPAWFTRLQARFSVLRDPGATPPRQIIRTALRESDQSSADLDFALAHRLVTPPGVLWVVPGPGRLCLALLTAGRRRIALGARCSSDALAERHGTEVRALGRVNPDRAAAPGNPLRIRIVGFAPDGTVGVTISHADGQTISVPVSGNGFGVMTRPGVTSTRQHIGSRSG